MAATPIDRREAERLGFRFLYKRPSVIAGRELWMVERNGLDYYLQLTPAPAPADPVLLGIGFGQDWTAVCANRIRSAQTAGITGGTKAVHCSTLTFRRLNQ